MPWIMRAIGVLVTLGLIGVSVMMNFRFGQSLGRTEWDGLVYGVASGCADGFKVILPFAIMTAWRGGRRVAAVAGAGLWLVFTAYSLTSSLGHSAVNRAETAGQRRHEVADYQDLRRELTVKLLERERLPSFRPLAAVEVERMAAQRNGIYERTEQCQEPARGGHVFCERYARLEVERATAARARDLEARIAQLRQRLADAGEQAKSGQSDAQTAILRELSGLADDYVKLALTVLVSIMVELGSGLGLYVVVGRRSSAGGNVELLVPMPRGGKAGAWRRFRSPSTTESWRRARIARDVTGHASEIELYRDYCLWLVKQDRGPALTLGDFRQWLEAEQIGEPVRKRGRIYYVGVKLVTPLLGQGVTDRLNG